MRVWLAFRLCRLHPHVVVKSVRGNLNTRLRKLDEGSGDNKYDALVLAAAGLIRLGWTDRIECSECQLSPRFVAEPIRRSCWHCDRCLCRAFVSLCVCVQSLTREHTRMESVREPWALSAAQTRQRCSRWRSACRTLARRFGVALSEP